MKRIWQNLLVITTVTVLVLQPFLASNLVAPKAEAEEEAYEGQDNTGHDENTDEEYDIPVVQAEVPAIQQMAENLEKISFDQSGTLSIDNEQISRITGLSDTPKLVLNPSDLQDIRILSCLGNVLPVFANSDDALAAATGKFVEEIMTLKSERPNDYKKLIEQAQESFRSRIVQNLRTDIVNFACIAGVDETQAVEMLRYDKDSVDAIIDYAQNKIIVDRRVLLILVNLVTPKNLGGAGHERIRVHRIRNSYNRDSRMYSRESDAIREEIAAKNQSEVSTVADVSAASRGTLDQNPEFASSDAQASVVNAAGTSQGDLIFNDTEDDANISAHAKGEALDISEVDNMKCTLIKKKRIGKAKKIPQPPTPIKLAWQTTEGYDRSPPPDYSSLQMNLRQIASGQYFDMLDELGINPDSEEDMSDASFSDVVGLIGESLLAEILNSPSNSLSGYSLSDTVKKIGGMILADKLGLPRSPFIEADLTNLSDLEAKIGEAVLEKKLNINYGSLRGNNLEEVLRNVGLRHIERQLEVPSGTITPGLSGDQLKITIGRRVIEEELRIQQGTFKSDTTYQKLRDVAGQRKIDLLFTNPSEVDEVLGIDFGYSERYKSGGLGADAFAAIVGAKLLADHAYIFNYTSASANAMALGVTTAAGTAGSQGLTEGQNNATLNTSTNIAQARFNWIMSGSLSAQGGIAPPSSFDDMYESIGAETLSNALSTNSETRAAINQWLTTNALSSQQNCGIPDLIRVTIPKPGSTTGETITVTIPEDQMMVTFGLRRGDLARLFGCYSVSPTSVFRGLGERALFEAVRNSTLVEQAQARFLADHPEISNFLADVEFYKSRIDTIRASINNIRDDWGSGSTGSQDAQALIAQINSSAASVATAVGSIDIGGLNIGNIGVAVRSIRNIPVLVDQILSAINTAQNGSDQSLRDRANGTLVDITNIIHAVDEILSGQAQPNISALQIGEINLNNRSNASSSENGTSINRATFALMLSGRLKPKDFLISVGANMIEDSLNLPTNGILYFAKYLEDGNRDKNDDKSAFFRAIGQAQVEETFNMPPFFFQGDIPAKKATLTDVKINISRSFGISEAEAGARIMRALGIPGEFSTIERQQIASISSVITAANGIDSKLSVSTGTTANFLNGKPLGVDSLGNSEVRMLAGAFAVPEAVINAFMRVRNGTESIDKAKENDYSKDISFNGHNEFADKPPANAGSQLSDQCPISFNFDIATKTFSSSFIQDNSYVYTDSTGTRSFPSITDARNFANSEQNKNNKIDFVQALSIGIVKSKGNATPPASEVNQINQSLTNFMTNQTAPDALPDIDTNLVAMRDMQGLPMDTLETAFTRKEIKDAQTNAKPIDFYLELIGKKTAERRIISTLLGGMAMTFGGLRIDATDIFDIFSGNGMQVAYRIGARFIEDHFDIPSNVIIAALEAPTDILRNCSLSKIGGNLLGSALGVGSVSLSGNIFENIGGSKIEKTLGLPDMSFRGANIDELISHIGAAKFAQVFHLPPDIVTPRSVVDSLLNDTAAANLSLQSYDDRASTIDNLLGDVGTIEYVTPNILSAAETSIENLVKQFVHDQSNYGPIAGTDNRSLQIVRFQQRLKQIDSMVGVERGSTEQLFKDQLSPDNYRKKAATGVMLANADNILAALGLSEYAPFVATAINIQQTLNDIKTCGSTPGACGRVRANIFNSLQRLLGINFDAKLGLPAGTISAIIADPQQAAYRMISGALTRLDESLGLTNDRGEPLGNASFTAAFAVWFREDYKGCETNPAGCLSNDGSNDSIIGGVIPISVNRWEYIARNIGDQLIGNYLNKIGIIAAPSPGTGHCAGFPDTQTLIRESTNMLIHGDLRILAISAAVKAAEALHLYEGSDNPNLPSYYRITFEDIYYAAMGNPILENQYVADATNNFYSNYTGVAGTLPAYLQAPTETSEMDGSPSLTYGQQCRPGESGTNCYNPDAAEDSDYWTYLQYDQSIQTFGQQNPTTVDQPTLQERIQAVQNDPNAVAQLAAAQEHARNEARREAQNNLLWRMADAQLYQLDHNIPPGFARAMFSGSGKERTTALLSYATNSLLGDLTVGGVSFDDIGVITPMIGELRDFFSNPSAFDLDGFVRSGHMATLDNWLTSKFSGFMGFAVQPGTFTAIFYGVKKGNFNFSTFNVGNIEIKSLTTIYTDWAISKITSFADKALGLPSGTVMTAYTMYRNINAARTGVTAASFGVAQAQNALNTAVGSGSEAAFNEAQANLTAAQNKLADAKARITSLKAELVSFIITTLFAKQIAAVESALGLVPGTGAILVSMAVSLLMGAAISPITIAIFILMNLFGVYKVEMKCTGDGYYPGIDPPTDPSVHDNGNLGVFDGMNSNARKDGYIAAARYKARTLAGDALMLSERTGDELAIPSQIMVGRQEDVDYWQYKTDEVICDRIGGCEGTRAGMWKNPQTTSYTHIGF